ncbi:MAG: methyl-accepting chemotaxis protein, partial [Planctomycetota bacterium]
MRTKLVGLVTVLLVLLGGAFMWMFSHQVRSAAHEESVAQARRVVDMAESIRHGESEKWKNGVFDQKTVRKWADAGQTDRVLGSVPIVSAWKAVMLKAEQGGYQLKTPRQGARNSDNEPNELSQRALEAFAASADQKEYVEYNEATNSMHYLRPIRLTSECMMCHGDPATSLTLWGNSDGLDPTGHHMENLNVGDLHGAFEVIQSLDAADARVASATWQGFGMISAFIAISCGILIWVLNRSLIGPLQKTAAAFTNLVRGDLRTNLTVSSKDEIGTLQTGFNDLAQQLRDMILNLQSSSEQLGSLSEGLDSTADRVSQSSEGTTTRSTTVSAA